MQLISKFLLQPTNRVYYGVYIAGIAVTKNYFSNQSHVSSLILHSVWIGSVGAISFMEAWVKFLAPTAKKTQLVDVGRHVNSALNIVERIFAFFSVLYAQTYYDYIPFVILQLQTWYTLPILRQRAKLMIRRFPISFSYVSAMQVLLEAIKMKFLIHIVSAIAYKI
ncbi:hypothetical protein HDV04_005398 [Boothiomyces sp. JEL0838]|nr:hypothetical protein HDV04_005398 [Boothiomyces sp. JEL0838]